MLAPNASNSWLSRSHLQTNSLEQKLFSQDRHSHMLPFGYHIMLRPELTINSKLSPIRKYFCLSKTSVGPSCL